MKRQQPQGRNTGLRQNGGANGRLARTWKRLETLGRGTDGRSQARDALGRTAGSSESGAEGASAGAEAVAHEGDERQQEQAERGRQVHQGDGADLHESEGATFFAGEQLGFRHAVGDGVGRIVEGELVAEAPAEDAATQQHQTERETAQAQAPTEPKLPGLFICNGDRRTQCAC